MRKTLEASVDENVIWVLGDGQKVSEVAFDSYPTIKQDRADLEEWADSVGLVREAKETFVNFWVARQAGLYTFVNKETGAVRITGASLGTEWK